ncbi:MAG: AAA family ATPase [Alphaproteobacteria bacterium]|nr:AAA family ATPase [Alphaproteobacteria bacterium]
MAMRHICFTGVESTGKSTLAQQLCATPGARLMPEYGREFAETISTDFTPDALRAIAREHARRCRALIAAGPALLIEDTDIVTTAAWFRMLHGHRDAELSATPSLAHRHLLFAPDTPWVADGTRQFLGSERLRFHQVINDELAQRGIAPVPISGNWVQRRAQAEAAIRSTHAPGEALT